MKRLINISVLLCFALGAWPVFSQFSGSPGGGMMQSGPDFSGSMAKLFGDNTTFSATLEMQVKGTTDDAMIIPGKMAYDGGKSRFEMDMTQIKGGQTPPEMAAHMKGMGMDKITMVTRPDKKALWMVYPGLKAYVERPLTGNEAPGALSDYKIETTELGKETVDGHPCVKNKAVVTDKNGGKHEATVWNATDMKNFPVRIEQNEEGAALTLLFKEVKLAKPAAAGFERPEGYAKHDNMMALMQQIMTKQGADGKK
jgi:hypothetical protein